MRADELCEHPSKTGPCFRLKGHCSPTHWGRLGTSNEPRCSICRVYGTREMDHATTCPLFKKVPKVEEVAP